MGVVLGIGNQAQAPDNQIHACLGPQGQTRIVDTPGACRPAERAVSWSAGGGTSNQLQLVDANGDEVAPVYGTSPGFTVPGLAEPVLFHDPFSVSGTMGS